MSTFKVVNPSDKHNPELWPRGTWRELDRPFSELQAEDVARRASWYKSEEVPTTIIAPSFVLEDATKIVASVISNIERSLNPIVDTAFGKMAEREFVMTLLGEGPRQSTPAVGR